MDFLFWINFYEIGLNSSNSLSSCLIMSSYKFSMLLMLN